MYSYNTLYYICQFCQSFFYIKNFCERVLTNSKKWCIMGANKKIPRARGGLTARPCSCVSEHTFKRNQRGRSIKAHGRVARTVWRGSA